MFTRRVFQALQSRDKLAHANRQFQDRAVPKTFYPHVARSYDRWPPLIRLFFHRPTFAILGVHRSGVVRQTLHSLGDEMESFDVRGSIVDADMHRISGRIFCLLSEWTVRVFENGAFGILIAPEVPRPRFFQERFLLCDKFGHLWIFIAKACRIYILDPVYLSLIAEFSVAPIKVNQICPLFVKRKLTAIAMAAKRNSTLYLCDPKGCLKEEFKSTSKCSRRLSVHHVIS
jgi:hypothetical protein